MNSGVNPANPLIVSAFRSALTHQRVIVGAIFLVLLLAWSASRGRVTARAQAGAALQAMGSQQ
jgi:ABC-type uncharacterized transport system involved in gliding motility auxiliary subunit